MTWQERESDQPIFIYRPRFILSNTQIGALLDSPEAWPPWQSSINLQGFTYSNLGDYARTGDANDTRVRPVSDWIDWLNKSRAFSLQPYNQLAKVLKEAGS